ncbi:MAG: hypothetical protein P1U83_14105 [Roseovarius sp.]|nr:hypothetical protein [Roseovarius sp.]
MWKFFGSVFFVTGFMSLFGAPIMSQEANSTAATPEPLNTFKTIAFGVNDPDLTEIPLWVNRMARLNGFELKNTGVTEIDITGSFRELSYASIQENPLLTDILNLNFAYAGSVRVEDNDVLTNIKSCTFTTATDVSIVDNPKLVRIDCLARMPFVQKLRLNDNDLDNGIWQNWTGSRQNLDFLNLSGNVRITELDERLVSSPIQNLDFSGTGISRIPAFVANLVALDSINMNNSCVSKAEYTAFRIAFLKSNPNGDGIEKIFPAPHQYSRGAHCAN